MINDIDYWDIESWAAHSRKGEVCGIFGCHQPPVKKCDHCGNYYCGKHKNVINSPGHGLKEPDREEFEYSGYNCLILRHPELGLLCGYVGVKAGYVCHGKHYDHLPYADLFSIDVHGGLTFADEGDGSWRPKGYWWLGFDCGHAWDLVPQILELEETVFGSGIMSEFPYRDFTYVKKQVERLADQLATLEFIDWEFTWVWPFLLPVRYARRIYEKRRS